MKNEMIEPGPNPLWLAFFTELFLLAGKLDRIEAERAQAAENAGAEASQP